LMVFGHQEDQFIELISFCLVRHQALSLGF